jgi:hypothetical protein
LRQQDPAPECGQPGACLPGVTGHKCPAPVQARTCPAS